MKVDALNGFFLFFTNHEPRIDDVMAGMIARFAKRQYKNSKFPWSGEGGSFRKVVVQNPSEYQYNFSNKKKTNPFFTL